MRNISSNCIYQYVNALNTYIYFRTDRLAIRRYVVNINFFVVSDVYTYVWGTYIELFTNRWFTTKIMGSIFIDPFNICQTNHILSGFALMQKVKFCKQFSRCTSLNKSFKILHSQNGPSHTIHVRAGRSVRYTIIEKKAIIPLKGRVQGGGQLWQSQIFFI